MISRLDGSSSSDPVSVRGAFRDRPVPNLAMADAMAAGGVTMAAAAVRVMKSYELMGFPH